MYTPKWSNHIFDEWKDVMRRKGVSLEESEKQFHNRSAVGSLPKIQYERKLSRMNREGGTIVLEANDDGTIIGIEKNAIEKIKM